MPHALTLPDVLAALLLLALNAYVLLGGADFGGGMWDLLAAGPRREAQRALIAHAIGPIWEANHVWLIFAVVLLFTCFPPAFAVLLTDLHLPVTFLLVGIVLRGSAFTFRTYDARGSAVQRRWGLVFSLSSVATPAALGVCVGAVVAGRVGVAPPGASFVARFVAPWANPFSLGVGAFTLALFAFLAAVYLTVESGEDVGLQRDFRRRALGAGVAVFVCAVGTLLLARAWAPRMVTRIGDVARSPSALALQVATGVAAIAAFGALATRRYRLARAAAAAQVSLILWGSGLAQYPFLVPPSLTVAGAAAPPVTLRLTLWAVLAGTAVLLPSLWYLFRVFKARPSAFGALDDTGH